MLALRRRESGTFRAGQRYPFPEWERVSAPSGNVDLILICQTKPPFAQQRLGDRARVARVYGAK